MKDEAQRVAIAEACGWREISLFTAPHHPCGFHPTEPKGKERLPDYLNDLNAMHEAEKVLGDCEIKWSDYKAQIQIIVEPHRHVLRSTAAQRAEAFLRTINKWQNA